MPFWIEARLLHQVVLELVALTSAALHCVYRRFCANLSNISNFILHVKLDLFLHTRPFQLTVDGLFLACEADLPVREDSRSKASRSAKYQ